MKHTRLKSWVSHTTDGGRGMRFIDYDKLHHAIEKKLLEYTPPALRNDYMRGCADGLRMA